MPSFARFVVSLMLVVGILLAVPNAAQAATVTINADYSVTAGTFDHAKVLNGNEGGYLTHNALTWLPESYPQLDQLGMRMVAITHLLNENFYNVVSGTAPNFSYDFSKLDRVVLPLVEQGITPLMGLAFTPEVLGGASKATGFSSAIPNNNAHWQQIVQAMVQHYKDLGHTGWYWEVWNEPDLTNGQGVPSFWAGTQAQFNAMYAATAEGVRAADPTAKVGGPTTTQGGWTFFQGFTTFLQNNPGVPLDFASFHTYGGNTFGETDAAKTRLDAAGRTGVPIFITEWNLTPNMTGGPGSATDTNVGASYVARRVADALDRPALSKVFWFVPKEGLTPTALMNGDLGMLTVDGHKKAPANTFQLLNKLYGTRLAATASGSGTSDRTVGTIATKDPATAKVAVLAWNDQNAVTDLSVNLSKLPYAGQNVRVTRYQIDATHGNYWQDYAEGLRGWRVGPYENADPVESRVVAGGESLTRTFQAAPHSVVLWLLEPTSTPPTDVPQVGPAPIPVGSRNLAPGRPATARTAVAFGWSPGAVVDGLTHTFRKVDGGPISNGWSSDGHATATASEWVQVDLGAPVSLSRVKLFPRDDKECEGYGFPVDFVLQGSNDGTTWSNLRTVTNHNGGQPLAVPILAQTFPVTGTFRYVRVTASRLRPACADDPSFHFQLAELQVESDTNASVGATAQGSTTIEDWGWSQAFANDGVRSSSGAAHGWSSALLTTNTPQHLTLRLPATTRLSRVDLFPRDEAGNQGAGFPKTFRIQVAADEGCAAWTTVASRANYPNPGTFARTIGFAAATARCVRIEATDLYRFFDGTFAFQLAEVELYH